MENLFQDSRITLSWEAGGGYVIRGRQDSGPSIKIIINTAGRMTVIPADAQVENLAITFVRP